MPKITYPRPCPTCGKPLSKAQFGYHKRVCSGHRYQCTQCSLSFATKSGLQRHVQQQHSPNPPRFWCPLCDQGFTSKHNRNLHVQTVCSLVKPSFYCEDCPAKFARKSNRQAHMRAAHGRICREQEKNLLLHLQPLSQNPDCRDEWMFVESRPIEPGEPRICPCGQTGISAYYFMNNEKNNNQTFVGSTCMEHIDPTRGRVVAYFHRLLQHPTRGTYRGVDGEGWHLFQVRSNTTLIQGTFHDDVKTYNAPIVLQDGKYYVKVKYPIATSPREGHQYLLRLKANYERGRTVLTVVECRYSQPEARTCRKCLVK